MKALYIFLLILTCLFGPLAQAANYTFPGTLPSGCSGSNGAYTCNSLTLTYGDTITVATPKPATLLINGNFNTDTSAINVSGIAADLTITVTGTLNVGYNANIKANIDAGSIVDLNGLVSFGGSLATTTGSISLGYQTTVSGSISSTSGAINVGQNDSVSGSVYSNSGSISIGYAAKVSGAVITGGSISLSQSSEVSACVKSTSSNTITLGYQATASAVCCGSSCGTSCVTNNSTYSMPAKCSALLAEYHLEETAWNGSTGEVKDSSGNNLNATTVGSAKPSPAATSPARSGATGTCGYASMPGPTNGGSAFKISNLPVSTATGDYTSVSFWMYWDNTDDVQPLGWYAYALWMTNGYIGFNTGDFDLYGVSSSGLANGWHHVVSIFNNGNVNSSQLYIDGVKKTLAKIGSIAPNNSYAVVQSTLMVGGWTANTSFRFPGRVDEIKIFKGALAQAEVTALYNETHTCPFMTTNPNHIRLIHNGSGVTCSPSSITVKACADSNCSSLFSGSTTVTLSSTSGTWSNNPITFTGSTSTNLSVTSAQSVTLGATSSPASASGSRCFAGTIETCTLSVASSGLLFDVTNHLSDSSQTLSVSAVSGTSNSGCLSAFANTSRALNFTCAYLDPNSGSLPIRVGSSALNSTNNASAACDSTGKAITLAFNANGIATTTVQYADVGQMQLSARYTGSNATNDLGLVMTGTDNFIAAPASFRFGSISSAPIKAGNNFTATVSALNTNSHITPNFGKESTPESVVLSHQLIQPTGSAAVAGAFSGSLGSFSSGSATSNNLNWSEVGAIQLNAALKNSNYLGSGFNATGSSGTIGDFVPDHFVTSVIQGCNADGFTYSGQPFTTIVTANNAAGVTTVNYDGTTNTSPNFAKLTTLSEGGTALGSFSPATVAASDFTAGIATSHPSFSLTNLKTIPTNISVRAADSNASSAGFTEGFVKIYSGRLSLQNANGSELQNLLVPLYTEYWAGNSYEQNTIDNCTTVPVPTASSGLMFGSPLAAGQSTASINGAGSGNGAILLGNGQLVLTKPSAGNTGYVDITIDAPSWLEFNWQGTGAVDPKARATFGVYKGDPKQIFLREVY